MRWSTGIPWVVAAGLTLLAGCGGNPIDESPAAASTPAGTPSRMPDDGLPTVAPTLTRPPTAGAVIPPGPTSDSAEPDGRTWAMPPGGPRSDGLPVAAGLIVSVEGASMVLEGDPRPTVHWAEQTTFAELIDATPTDLAVGRCAQVRPARLTGAAPGDQAQGRLTAAAVTISDAVDGRCAPGPAMGPGPDHPRADGPGPRYWFEWRESGRPGPRGLRGIVTAVDGDSFTIELPRHVRDVGPSGSGPQPETRRIATAADTDWHRIVVTDSAAVQVGRCATATGRRAGPGHVHAESIMLRPAENGRCAPLPRIGPGGPGRPGGPGERRVGPGQDGPRERPWLRRAPEHRPRPAPRPEQRPAPRQEGPSGGGGAGGGAAASSAR
jgi:hypothetical protein